jgi:hypothetical protein
MRTANNEFNYSVAIKIHGALGIISFLGWLIIFANYLAAWKYLGYFPKMSQPDPKELPFFTESIYIFIIPWSLVLLTCPIMAVVLVYFGKIKSFEFANYVGLISFVYWYIDRHTLHVLGWIMD